MLSVAWGFSSIALNDVLNRMCSASQRTTVLSLADMANQGVTIACLALVGAVIAWHNLAAALLALAAVLLTAMFVATLLSRTNTLKKATGRRTV